MKKFVLTSILAAMAASADTIWTDPSTQIQWAYTVTNGGARVKCKSKVTEKIIVPEYVDGYPVVRLAYSAFSEAHESRGRLAGIELPSTLKEIGEFAFLNTQGITNIVIPSSVTNIGIGAFYHSPQLREIQLQGDNDFYSVKDGVLYSKDGKTLICYPSARDYLALPTEITNLYGYAVGDGNWTNENVVLPPRLTVMGEGAFYGCCDQLRSLTFPKSFKKIMAGCDPFAACFVLRDVYFEGEPPEGLERYVFNARTIHYNVAYQDQWLKTFEGLSLTKYAPYLPGVPETTADVVEDWITNSLVAAYAPSSESRDEYIERFRQRFGNSSSNTFFHATGKIGSDGLSLFVGHDFVAGTDPLDTNDVFRATVKLVGSKPVLSYLPQLSEAESAKRKYRTWGKSNLSDTEWYEIQDLSNVTSRFFKVTVEMP